MSLMKFATFQITSAVLVDQGMSRTAALAVTAHRAVFDYEPRPGYLYVRSRAISSRCNDNFDEFPAEEIKKAYKTFIGKPVFVNHHNDNHRRARGVIIDAALHEDRNPDGSPDTWTEVLMEVDAKSFPKLAKAILAGEIDRTSMGTDVAYSVCSVCNNKASSPTEYCQHIPKMKGQRIYRTTASGRREGILVRERCYGLGFFENSLLVEEPADPTAFFLGVDDRGLRGGKTASLATEVLREQAQAIEASKEYPRFDGVGLKQDDDGYYVATHRARSKSYKSPEAIPDKDVEFIRSTGSKTAASIPLSPDDHEFYRQMYDQAQTSQEMDAHARTRPVNLADPADLVSHMFQAHGWDENDLWRNSHPADHPAMMGATDDDRPLTHGEVRAAHEHEHNVEYPHDYPDAITLGDSHFHTASKRTASWIGDHPDEPTLFWRAPKSGWEVHVENHTPDRQLRDEYGAKAHQQAILYHSDHIQPAHPNAPAGSAPRGGWRYERDSNTGAHRYNPNTWGYAVGHIPAHVQKQVDNAQAEIDKHAEDHANLYGGLADNQDLRDDVFRAERDHQQHQRWQEQFANSGRECTWCHGSGKSVVDGVSDCPGCDGSGRHTATRKQAGFLNDKDSRTYPSFWAKPSGDAGYHTGHVIDPDTYEKAGLDTRATGLARKATGPFYVTRHPETRAHQVVDHDNRLVASMPGGHNDGQYGHDTILEAWHGANQAKGHIPAETGLTEAIGRHPKPPFAHSTEDPEDAMYQQRAQANPAREHAPEGHSNSEEWHGPYEVVKHPETGKFHVVDNAGRQAGGWHYDSKGFDDQWQAERRRDSVDDRAKSKEQARGIAEKIFNSFNDIVDPGGTEESRRSDRNIGRMNSLMDRYEGGTHHPLSPGRFGNDDAEHEGDGDGEPYYEVSDPGGSGWKARDYGGPYLHVHHEATGEEEHDVIGVNGQHGRDPGFGHEEMHQALHNWAYGDPEEEGDDGPGRYYAKNHPLIKRWQQRKGYTAMKRTAFGETKAPADVDTLRDEECPVCGESDSYDGNSCQVCGFDAPPQMFRDPNLDLAKQLDLRKDNLEESGSLPGQDGLDPTQQDLNGGLPGEVPGDGVPGSDQAGLNDQVPVDPSMVNADGTVTPAADPSIILQQQMDQLQSGVPLTPDQLGPNGEVGVGGMDPQLDPEAATGHFDQGGEPFTPGPNAPMPEEPMQPGGQVGGPMDDDTVDPDALDEQGQPIQDPGAGDPGTPDDGVPDLVCPACGFEADAQQPTSVDMDTQALPADGTGDGTLAGDVCPNCGQAQMTSVGEMEQAQQQPLPV